MTSRTPFEIALDQRSAEVYFARAAQDNSAFRAAFRRAFCSAVRDTLTARQFQTLWAHAVEGKSGVQIARQLGVSPSAVSRHLQRGKRRLRRLLSYNLKLQSDYFSQITKDD